MDAERTIGRVVKVKTYQALVELQPDTLSYVKSSHGGMFAIAALNSYVILPIGSERVVAIVTGLDMAEEHEANIQHRQILVIPKARRTMWISLVGTITQRNGVKRFAFGIRRYPELDNPVWFAIDDDLDAIFEKETPDADRNNRLVSIGRSPLFSDYEVKIDIDRFFGKHAAVLGNTGSGKSCTITALIKAVMEHPNGNGMPNAHFIIFDTNAEYAAAFTQQTANGQRLLYDRLVIHNDADVPTGFWLPHWFMNGRDYTAFFRPGEGAQGPLLQSAIGIARASQQLKAFRLQVLNSLEVGINIVTGLVTNPPTGTAAVHGIRNLRTQLEALQAVVQHAQAQFLEMELGESAALYEASITSMIDSLSTEQFAQITAQTAETLLPILARLRQEIARNAMEDREEPIEPVGIDTPAYFDFDDFVTKTFREILQREAQTNNSLRNWVGTLLLRLDQARQDPRYKFFFGAPKFSCALASYLRLIFGVEPAKHFATPKRQPPWREFYLSQHEAPIEHHHVTILDLSALASDVLENMTALVGRLILEFMQRCPDRGKYPVVLVLEEAHHYIPADARLERQQRAREVFERIAKEGRKYGLSLVVASQRPSELSRTVLAQCNSFIVHRIQNPDDQDYFRSVVSSINRELLDQLPALAQQHALVMGDCVTVPHQVRIHDVSPKPDSHDPEFFRRWSDPASVPPDFEGICAAWEGTANDTDVEDLL